MFRAMTIQSADAAAGARAPATRGLWRAELNGTIKLALPIALTQLGQVAMMTSDLILIGHLGESAIAGAALGQTVLFGGNVVISDDAAGEIRMRIKPGIQKRYDNASAAVFRVCI